MNLLDKVDELMKENGIKNKKDLAEKSGIPYTTIMSLYNRSFENVTLSTLKKLTDFFDCSLDYLADDDKLLEKSIKNENDLTSLNEFDGVYFKFADGYTIDDLSEEDKALLKSTLNVIKKNIDKEKDG